MENADGNGPPYEGRKEGEGDKSEPALINKSV